MRLGLCVFCRGDAFKTPALSFASHRLHDHKPLQSSAPLTHPARYFSLLIHRLR